MGAGGATTGAGATTTGFATGFLRLRLLCKLHVQRKEQRLLFLRMTHSTEFLRAFKPFGTGLQLRRTLPRFVTLRLYLQTVCFFADLLADFFADFFADFVADFVDDLLFLFGTTTSIICI